MKQTQSLGLKQLLTLSQILRSPAFPNATRGLQGMIVADEILKRREAIGILIGGLSTSIYQGGPLNRHKDVDVMVATDDFALQENFEGGIDWWIPYQDKLRIDSAGSYMENALVKWWENGNGVVLSFGIQQKSDELPNGLLSPAQQWVVNMRLTEAMSNVDARVEGVIDEDVIDVFREKFEQEFSCGRIREDVRKALGENIIDENEIELVSTELPIVRAVMKKRMKMKV